MTIRYEFTIDSTYVDQSPRTSVIIAEGDFSWIAAIGRTSSNEDPDGVATYSEADDALNILTACKRIGGSCSENRTLDGVQNICGSSDTGIHSLGCKIDIVADLLRCTAIAFASIFTADCNSSNR